jgi:alcohol dehydrogenase (cytochrome c)
MHISKTIGVIVGGALAATFALPAAAADVTQSRMDNADKEPHNWIMHHKNYYGHRHMTIDQININNIGNLKLAFTVAVGGIEGAGRHSHGRLEGTPIVENGMMYYPNGWGELYKVDVSSGKSGTVVWYVDPAVDKAYAADVACCGVNNRGVVLWKDQVISTTLDSRVISTNKETGEITWETAVGDPAIAETMTLAPLVMNDISVTGVAGAEYGVRGHLDGVDLNTGEHIWQTFTAGGNDRDPNETAKSTWTDNYDSWETGGGSIWQTGTWDKALNLMYWGTGNPGPDWDPEYRPGDNLYTDTLLAMTPEDGMIKWFFQYTPNDPYDYDEIAEHPIVVIDGETVVTHSSRNGYQYAFNAGTGAFKYAIQYVNDMIWTKGIDQKTGLPNSYNPNTALQDYRGTAERRNGRIGIHCPRISGGKNWPPSATDPDRLVTFIPGIEGCQLVGAVQEDLPVHRGGTVKPRDRFTGGNFGVTEADMTGPFSLEALGLVGEMGPLVESGSLQSVNLRNGETINKIQLRYSNRAGILSSAGGWIMTAYINGDIIAYDANTFDIIWSFNAGTPIKATPMSYAVNGKQYIALMVGGNISGGNRSTWPELANIQFQHSVYVFTL